MSGFTLLLLLLLICPLVVTQLSRAMNVIGTPVLGSNVCTRGPGYWCKNLETATQCRSVQHCTQIYWSQPTADDLTCDLCKQSVLTFGDLKSNGTEEEILSLLLRLCDASPSDEGLRSQCKEIARLYFPVLVSTLKQALTGPSVLCSSLGLCGAGFVGETKAAVPHGSLLDFTGPLFANLPLLPPQQLQQQQGDNAVQADPSSRDPCAECVGALGSKPAASQFEPLTGHLVSQCERLQPTARELCKSYAVAYGGQLAQAIVNMTSEEACVYSGFCPKDLAPKPPKLSRVQLKRVKGVKFGPTCVICEFIMNKIDDYLISNRTEKAVVDAVEQVCGLLPSTVTDECRDLVDRYGETIVHLLLRGLSPAVICTILGLCLGREPPIPTELPPSVRGDCALCKLLVREVDSALDSRPTRESVDTALRDACSHLPSSLTAQCAQMVRQSEPKLTTLLLQTTNPDTVCAKVKVCAGRGRGPVGGRSCTWGPAYWCRDPETAQTCGATEYCRDQVWKKDSSRNWGQGM